MATWQEFSCYWNEASPRKKIPLKQIQIVHYPSDCCSSDKKQTIQPRFGTHKSSTSLSTVSTSVDTNNRGHQYRPFDIMLRLPARALNSISWVFATVPDASIFCTAKTVGKWIPICDYIREEERTYAQYSVERGLVLKYEGSDKNGRMGKTVNLSWKTYLMSTGSNDGVQMRPARTHDVNLRFESAAWRSLTCAFWVALYWTFNWSRRV